MSTSKEGTMEVSIEQLKELQRDAEIPDLHLVWLGPERFNLAHTDPERASGKPLTDCALHRWLVARAPDDLPAEPGAVYVVVPSEPDAYQAFNAEEPWDFFLYSEWCK